MSIKSGPDLLQMLFRNVCVNTPVEGWRHSIIATSRAAFIHPDASKYVVSRNWLSGLEYLAWRAVRSRGAASDRAAARGAAPQQNFCAKYITTTGPGASAENIKWKVQMPPLPGPLGGEFVVKQSGDLSPWRPYLFKWSLILYFRVRDWCG